MIDRSSVFFAESVFMGNILEIDFSISFWPDVRSFEGIGENFQSFSQLVFCCYVNIDEWMNEWINERTNERMNKLMASSYESIYLPQPGLVSDKRWVFCLRGSNSRRQSFHDHPRGRAGVGTRKLILLARTTSKLFSENKRTMTYYYIHI